MFSGIERNILLAAGFLLFSTDVNCKENDDALDNVLNVRVDAD